MEIKASLAMTRLYQNLGDKVSKAFFYDVKNARLVNVFGGECLMHREQLLDKDDLERFMSLAEPMMTPGHKKKTRADEERGVDDQVGDAMWILAGRTDSNAPEIKKLLTQFGLNSDVFSFATTPSR